MSTGADQPTREPFPPSSGRFQPPPAVLVIVLGIAAVAVLFTAYAALGRWVLHGPVDGRSLYRSVELAAGSDVLMGSDGRCRRTADDDGWRCEVSDAGASGTVRYEVRVEPDSSCWTARLLDEGGEGPMPRTVDGCVHRWQWTIVDLLG